MRYQWHRDMWSRTGCEGEFLDPGWYTAAEDKFVVREYINPKTNKPYNPTELDKIQGVVVPPYVPVPGPYIPPVKKSGTSIWITIGIVLLVVAGVAIWFFVK